MRGYNHVAGGLTFTATFASFSDINILAEPQYLAATAFLSLLPDIDHSQSLIGKVFRPLSGWLYTRFGHRTLTHSLPFYLVCVAATAATEHLLGTGRHTYTAITALALLSHLIFDMCTQQGIPFFYPFSKVPCVLPGNPNLRVRNEDMRHQAAFFLISVSLFFFCQPLYAEGFVSRFNKAFLDFDHIEKEARRSGDVLEVTFREKGKGSETGLLVAVQEKKMMIFQESRFRTVEKENTSFQDFRHTGRTPRMQAVQAFGVSADSLRVLLRQPVVSGHIQSDADMNWHEGSLLKTAKEARFEYRTDFDFTASPPDMSAEQTDLSATQAHLYGTWTAYRHEARRLDSLRLRLRRIQSGYAGASDYEKGKLIEERRALETAVAGFRLPPPDVAADHARIRQLQQKMIVRNPTFNANLTVWTY